MQTQDQPTVITLPSPAETEHQRTLLEWNATSTEYPKEKCVHQLFEAQVERTPDAVAVVFGEEQLTYRELNRRANQLAHYLRELGVGPEALVSVCVGRSIELVVTLLGILKAGGAYVPLDPTYPKERLAFMFADTGAPVLVAQDRLVPSLPAHSAKVARIDTEWGTIAQHKDTNPENQTYADNLAYMMYTSGSTGQPKGICIPHRGIVRLVKNTNYIRFSPEEVFLQFAPSSFDASTLEIWGSLLNGARLVVFPSADVPSLEELGQALQRYRVSTLWLTAGLFHQMVENQLEKLAGVRQLLAGGDVVFAPHARRVLQQLEGCTLVNGYGPTENTTFTCCYPMTHPDQVGASVSIGRPISNTQVYLLDGHMQPVPIGTPGELYIGGDGLARGYLNRPDLTAERFVPNPFSKEPGARLYKTGDLVRYLPDGNIEFIGRIDNQVKIRGFRIELGEIEAVLGQHSGVREVVVTVREDVPGDKRLVAYVVPHPSQPPTPGELRAHVKERLPEYMVPSGFVFIHEMPLTPNGKVDRKALPAPEPGRSEEDSDYVGPRTPVEEVMARIWASVLGVECVGVHDNFFDAGGHSLGATQVISRLREEFHLDLPLRSLFETPTVAGLAASVEAALQGGPGVEVPPLLPTPRTSDMPLSFAQQRMWFLNQWDAGSPAFNIPIDVRLKGELNRDALERALNAIVQRHEALRTTFAVVDGQPVQVINPSLDLSVAVVDVQHVPVSEREEAAYRLATRESQQPFDLEKGPLLRATLLRLGERDHILLLVVHHIASDGWSMGVLFRELAVLYPAFIAGEPSPLPDLPVQYADFAAWQREVLQGEVLQDQVSYWKTQLTGAAPLELPTDRPHPPVQTYHGARLLQTLPKGLADELEEVSRREGVTLFMTLLAAFQALLSRYTGQSDIVVTTPIAGRTRPEIEGLIGFFVNGLVLRTDLSGDPTFREALERVREVALGAYAHQDLPFEKLVEELQLERDLSRPPLSQVVLVLQNTPMETLRLQNLTLSNLQIDQIDTETSRFELTLAIEYAEDGLLMAAEYNTDLFDGETIRRMMGHYHTLLQGAVSNLDGRISELPIMTEDEQQQTLVGWNDTRRDYPKDQCVHQLFEAQVARTPDAVAIMFEERQLTYRELNGRANQVAHHLRKLGVGPDVPVGICVERSIEMMVGLLGILKAGGAYVPLDPAYPRERLAFMLADSQAAVLVTEKRLNLDLPVRNVLAVYLDADQDAIAQEPQDDLDSGVTPDHPIYLIYTSGSTGQPKGVFGLHRGAVNRFYWMWETYPFAEGELCCQKTALSFVDAAWEVFGPLLRGVPLLIISDTVLKDAELFISTLANKGVTRIVLVPSFLRVLLDVGGDLGRKLPRLKTWLTSGEALPVGLAQRFREVMPGSRLLNLYGSSEVSADVTWHDVSRSDGELLSVPVGRPIANTRIYILDARGLPVPIGVPGELHAGGAGLARGYWDRPDLTAERFVPDPFSGEPGARLYKLGDLARYLPDGNIEYLGRRDHQEKIRGFRVEPDEVAAILRQHRAVKEGVVVAREDTAGDKRLVAYVILHPEESATSGDLRAFLKEQLPDYMVPSAFVMLDALPRTPNGKVDRRALPAPQQAHSIEDGNFVTPRDPVESVLAGMWAELLNVGMVSIHDSFFDLGGHSLLATQLISRVREAFRVELPLRLLFEDPTIEAMARALVAEETKPGRTLKIAQVLQQVEAMSASEVAGWLQEQQTKRGNV